MARSVLVTGMSGLIGRALRKEMEGRYDLRALNRSAMEAGVVLTELYSERTSLEETFFSLTEETEGVA